MVGFKPLAILAVALIGYAVGEESHQPNLVSFGDFMEFDIGLHKACESATGGSNTTWEVISSFSDCTTKLSAAKPQDPFETVSVICQNRGKYLQCWDDMRKTVSDRCGKDKEPHLPAVYRATAAAFCGNDNGATTVGNFRKAAAEGRPEDEQNCPQQTAPWIETCQEFVPTMNSADVCARQTAISKCLQKITCDNVKVARMLREQYSAGRAHLQCNERRA